MLREVEGYSYSVDQSLQTAKLFSQQSTSQCKITSSEINRLLVFPRCLLYCITQLLVMASIHEENHDFICNALENTHMSVCQLQFAMVVPSSF